MNALSAWDIAGAVFWPSMILVALLGIAGCEKDQDRTRGFFILSLPLFLLMALYCVARLLGAHA